MQDKSRRSGRAKKLGIVMIAEWAHTLDNLDVCIGGFLIRETAPISFLASLTFNFFDSDEQFTAASIA